MALSVECHGGSDPECVQRQGGPIRSHRGIGSFSGRSSQGAVSPSRLRDTLAPIRSLRASRRLDFGPLFEKERGRRLRPRSDYRDHFDRRRLSRAVVLGSDGRVPSIGDSIDLLFARKGRNRQGTRRDEPLGDGFGMGADVDHPCHHSRLSRGGTHVRDTGGPFRQMGCRLLHDARNFRSCRHPNHLRLTRPEDSGGKSRAPQAAGADRAFLSS